MGRPRPRNKRLTRDQMGPKQQQQSRKGSSRSLTKGSVGKRESGNNNRNTRQKSSRHKRISSGSKEINNQSRSVTIEKRPTFSEWVEQEGERRELARQQLIRQREGVFEGPVVDVLAMEERDKRTLMNLVNPNVSQIEAAEKLIVAKQTHSTLKNVTQKRISDDWDNGVGSSSENVKQKVVTASGVSANDANHIIINNSLVKDKSNHCSGVAEVNIGPSVEPVINTPVIDASVVPDVQLKDYLTTQLLFDEADAIKALQATDNAGLVPALDWLCLHTSDEQLGHAFYGKAPVLNTDLFNELVANTSSISVRQFDFIIEMLLFSMMEQLGTPRDVVQATVETMLHNAIKSLQTKGSNQISSSGLLRCPPELPARVLRWCVRQSLLREMIPSETWDEVETSRNELKLSGHMDVEECAEMREDELLALRSMYGDDNVIVIPVIEEYFHNDEECDTKAPMDTRKLLIAPQLDQEMILTNWLLRQYYETIVTVELQLEISPKLSNYCETISRRNARAEGDKSRSGTKHENIEHAIFDSDVQKLVIHFTMEQHVYPVGSLPTVFVNHPVLRKAGTTAIVELLKEAHKRMIECIGGPCIFSVVSFLTDEVASLVQLVLDDELATIEKKEKIEKAKRKATRLKNQAKADAEAKRRERAAKRADPRKLQAEFEAKRKKALQAKSKKTSSSSKKPSRASQKALLKQHYKKQIARAVREGNVKNSTTAMFEDKHYKQYYGHLDEDAEKKQREQEARKRHEDAIQKQLHHQEKVQEQSKTNKNNKDTGQQSNTQSSLDFEPNDFLKSLVDEVFYDNHNDDHNDDATDGLIGQMAGGNNLSEASKDNGTLDLESTKLAKLEDQRLARKRKKLKQKSLQLYEAERKKIQSTAYKSMLKQRQGLPCYQRKDKILKLICNNTVVVLSGETGCGKTTQLPQMVLEDMMIRKQGAHCNIICTQPRRISAIGVSERVAHERCEQVGQSVGYTIRLEKKRSKDTRLLFCTTGVLLRRLQFNSNLSGVSHIFVDEVHERDLNSDMLLILLRDLLRVRAKTTLGTDTSAGFKIILMSATINADKFSHYFGGAPTLNVPGRTFPVTPIFLEDILEQTGHEIVEGSDFARKKSVLGSRRKQFKGDKENGPNSQNIPSLPPLTKKQLHKLYPNHSASTIQSLAIVDEAVINYDLLEVLLEHIHEVEPIGAVLVFMPGMMEITKLYNRLRDSSLFQDQSKFVVYPLHSALTTEAQKMVFIRPPHGVRKIVISTNIAETSITIDDCVCVVDSGRVKENRFDTVKNMATLLECWVAQASAKQRRGRAGRVREGTAYHLFSSHTWTSLDEYTLPEMLRVPLDETILQLKMLNVHDVRAFFRRALDPPSHAALDQALSSLSGLQALEGVELFNGESLKSTDIDDHFLDNEMLDHDLMRDGHLTPLGYHLAALAVSPRIGKMLIFGAILRCLGPILTVAAALSYRSPFAAPFDKRDEADACKRSFAKGSGSDLFCIIHAYNGWLEAINQRREKQFLNQNFLSRATLVMIRNMRRQFLNDLVKVGFLTLDDGNNNGNFNERHVKATKIMKKGKHIIAGERSVVVPKNHNRKTNQNKCKHDDGLGSFNEQAQNQGLLTAVLVAGLYPNILLASDTIFDRFGNPQLNTIDDHEVKIHPSSINFQATEKGNKLSRLMIFHEKVRTTQVYVRDTTPVSPYPVLLFGGTLDVYHRQGVVVLGNWIGFKVAPKVAVLTKTLRMMLEQLLKQKIKDPSTDLSGGSGQPVLNAISMLMSRSSSKTETTRLTNDVGKKSNSATISSSQKYLEEEKTSFHNSNPNKLPSQTTKCNSARDEALTWMDNYEQSIKPLMDATQKQEAQAKKSGRLHRNVRRYGFYSDLKKSDQRASNDQFVSEARTDEDGYRVDIGTGSRFGISFVSDEAPGKSLSDSRKTLRHTGGRKNDNTRGRGRGYGKKGRGRGREHGRKGRGRGSSRRSARTKLDVAAANRLVRHSLPRTSSTPQ